MTIEQNMAVSRANEQLIEAGLPSYTELLLIIARQVQAQAAPAYTYAGDTDSLPSILRRQAT